MDGAASCFLKGYAAAILSEEGYGMQNYTSYPSFMGG
jgi:hypothetical protein